MKFLQSDNYHAEVQALFANQDSLDVAVAFLGADVLPLFQANPAKPIRLLCNFQSDACHPELIKALLHCEHVQLRSHPALHAKLLLQRTVMISGSANLSTNGLCLEGAELDGWQEAGVRTRNKKVIAQAKDWFKRLWRDATPISAAECEAQAKNWQRRRALRPVNPEVTQSFISAAFAGNKTLVDRAIYFVCYRDVLSAEAKAAFEQVSTDAGTAASAVACYEDWEALPDNAYLLAIRLGPEGGVYVENLYQTPAEPVIHAFNYENGERGSIKLCFAIKQIHGIPYKYADKKFIKAHSRHLIKHPNFQADDAFLVPLMDWVAAVKQAQDSKSSDTQ